MRATIKDLYDVEGAAELIDGKIVHQLAGARPGEIGGNVLVSLRAFAKATGRGKAVSHTVAYVVPLMSSGRESFSPFVSYHARPRAANPMSFIKEPPDFAVEIRGEGDFGKAAEERLAAKRADYFEAGTQVVWDVDPEAETVQVYRAADPAQPTLFRRGQIADAEPAVPGWRLSVDEVFE